jgi:O-Antigen ligase
LSLKALFGFTVLPAAFLGGIIVACLSKRIRDLFFVGLVFFSPMLEFMSVNFESRDFYRGTSRGFEVCIPDILAVSLLASSVLVPRRGENRGYWPASFGLMLLFFFYACFNVGLADPKIFGLFELSKMVRGFIFVLAVAFYLRSEREMRWLIFSVALIVCFEGLLALKQRYVDGIHRVLGTIDDSNSLSVFMCMMAPVCVAAINCSISRRLKIFCAVAVALAGVAEVLTLSRAGVIIIAMVMFGAMLCTMSYQFNVKKVVYGLLIVSLAAGVVGKSWNSLKARFESSNLEQEYANKKTLGRGYYIRIAKAIAGDQLFGVGLNNWSYWVSQKYGPKLGYRFVPYSGTDRDPKTTIPPESNVDEAQAAPAHSLGALTAGELGLPGLILFGLVWLRWFQMGASFLWPRTTDPMRRMGVGLFFGFSGIFLQSLTEWVFRQSPIYFEFNILLGALVSVYYLRRHPKIPSTTGVQVVSLEGEPYAPQVFAGDPCEEATARG